MKKEIYKGYTIKEGREKLAGGFLVQVTYAVYKDKTKICNVLSFEYGKKKIDQLTMEVA
jgi:hypothetical protein